MLRIFIIGLSTFTFQSNTNILLICFQAEVDKNTVSAVWELTLK